MARQMSVKEARAQMYLASVRLDESYLGRFRRDPTKYMLIALVAGLAAGRFSGIRSVAYSLAKRFVCRAMRGRQRSSEAETEH
jgi:hypothetical protein